ncbi:hypothetical protein D6B98_00010 [Bradyrhizobium sp. LVM 105]|nr:hypothetical protein D6B98_00010 [Bradyrhizobium sp. LVM 105]
MLCTRGLNTWTIASADDFKSQPCVNRPELGRETKIRLGGAIVDPPVSRSVIDETAGSPQVDKIADTGLDPGEEWMPRWPIKSAFRYPYFCRPDQAAASRNVVAARQKLLEMPLHQSIIREIFWAPTRFER